MTPLEVNIKIAEAKEYRLIKHTHEGQEYVWIADNNGLFRAITSDSLNKDGFRDIYFETQERVKNLPNWSENISDAWELFEENPEVYVKKLQYVDKKIDYECVFRDSDLKVIGSAKASTAPMAICLAWLAWKESK